MLTFLGSCQSPKPVRILPNLNIDKMSKSGDTVNSQLNDVAPYQRMSEINCIDAYSKEVKINKYNKILFNIKPANSFFPEILGTEYKNREQVLNELTNKLEAVTFLTKNSGIVAISHAPDSNFCRLANLDLYGSIGGTDLFAFNYENSKFIFRALPTPINSTFWDSHPWIGQDSLCNYVIIWSSDRNNPFSVTKDLNGNNKSYGNTDLFYSFRINDEWSEPQSIVFDSVFNTKNYNEISPFVACTRVSPKLLFSSNVNGDYDIFVSDIKIDFATQKIEVLSEPLMFEKGNQYDFSKDFINTDANEIFPYLAYPYSQENNSKSLFFSSDRNKSEKPLNIKADTLVVNMGEFDIYSSNIEMECLLPKVEEPVKVDNKKKIHITLIDKYGNKVQKPVLKIINEKSKDSLIVKADNFELEMEHGGSYRILGGSYHTKIDHCDTSVDSLLQMYKAINYKVNNPKIVRHDSKIEYDSIVNPKLMVSYDTVIVTEVVPLTNELLEIKKIENKDPKTSNQSISQTSQVIDFKVVDCKKRYIKNQKQDVLPTRNSTINSSPDNSKTTLVEVQKMLINKHEWTEGGKVIKKTLTRVNYDTIPQIDTLYTSVNGPNIVSKLTSFSPIIADNISKAIVFDTIIIDPYYFKIPECEVEFVNIRSEFNKNIPFYQTAFWKVNTSAGLRQHLESFKTGNYLERAGYIELHPKHRKYGYGHKEAREVRLAEYQEYAKQVDANLAFMTKVVTDEFLPILNTIEKLDPNVKLFLKLEAYSDVRDASVCYYIGNTVEFIQGSENEDHSYEFKNEIIKNNATLSNNNENLSNLRVFYGFGELFERLKKNKKFSEYLAKGLIFYPTMKFDSDAERDLYLEKSKIVIFVEGKFYDKVLKQDEKDYDPIRRLNLVIKLIKIDAGRIVPADCCK